LKKEAGFLLPKYPFSRPFNRPGEEKKAVGGGGGERENNGGEWLKKEESGV
jgi:hypothetical protein